MGAPPRAFRATAGKPAGNVPRHGKSLYISPISRGLFMGFFIPKNPMATLLRVHPIVPWESATLRFWIYKFQTEDDLIFSCDTLLDCQIYVKSVIITPGNLWLFSLQLQGRCFFHSLSPTPSFSERTQEQHSSTGQEEDQRTHRSRTRPKHGPFNEVSNNHDVCFSSSFWIRIFHK